MSSPVLASVAALLTDITFLFNVFIFFAYDKTGRIMYISYVPWAAGTVLILLLNRYLLRKTRTVAFVFTVNALVVSIWAVSAVYFFFHGEGIWPNIWALLLIIFTGGRAAYFALQAITESQALIRTELSYIFAGTFFLVQSGSLNIPMIFSVPSLVMIMINMLALIRLRIFDKHTQNDSISRWQGLFFMLTMVGVIGGVTLGTMLLLSPSFRLLFLKLLNALKELVITIIKFLIRLLEMIFGTPKQHPMDLPPPEQQLINNERLLKEVQTNISRWVLLIILAVILLAIIWLIIRLARELLQRRVALLTSGEYREKAEWPGLSFLSGFFKKVWYKLKFFMLWKRRKYTPEGTFLIIEKLGRRKGFPRAIDETPTSYLKRLYSSVSREGSFNELEIKRLNNILVEELERSFYGERSNFIQSSTALEKGELKTLIRHYLA